MKKIIFILTFFYSCSLFALDYQNAEIRPWLRFEQDITNVKISPNSKFIAFEYAREAGLYIMEINDNNIYKVSKFDTSGSYFWSPDGFRLFLREHKSVKNKIVSTISAYDAFIHKKISLKSFEGKSGYLNFDSRDLRFTLLHENGLFQSKIDFPTKRLKKWQSYKAIDHGKWVAAKKGIYWHKSKINKLELLKGDMAEVESFSISSDGLNLAWGSKEGRIYVSHKGEEPRFIGRGKHPNWHPRLNKLVFSGAVLFSTVVRTHDIMVMNSDGKVQKLTNSSNFNEIWPVWHPKGDKIIFTKQNQTDLYIVDYLE